MRETIPVVEKAFHEAGDRRHEGNAGLAPGFLFDLLQQAAGGRVGEADTTQLVSLPRAHERGPGGPAACDGSGDGRLTTRQSHLG